MLTLISASVNTVLITTDQFILFDMFESPCRTAETLSKICKDFEYGVVAYVRKTWAK